MAYEGTLRTIPGLVASGDLSAAQFLFMTVSATGAALNTTDAGIVDGVLQNKPDALGKEATVAFSGVSKVVAGAAITAGALVKSDTAGKAITATTGDEVAGRAIEAAAADGNIISVLLDTQGESP